MGTYNLSAEEIADIFEEVEFESKCEGDFTAETFLEGVKIYLEKLKSRGMSLPYAEGLRFKIIQNFNKRKGKPLFFLEDRKTEQHISRILWDGEKWVVDIK